MSYVNLQCSIKISNTNYKIFILCSTQNKLAAELTHAQCKLMHACMKVLVTLLLMMLIIMDLSYYSAVQAKLKIHIHIHVHKQLNKFM